MFDDCRFYIADFEFRLLPTKYDEARYPRRTDEYTKESRIFVYSWMAIAMNRPRIQHVSIPRPPGSHAQTRTFYGALLGLEEIPVPASIQQLDLIWYRLGETELHCFTEEMQADRSGRHFCIEVDDLESLRARLEAAGYTPRDPIAIPGRPRFFCRDPFGNDIEFTTIQHDYLDHDSTQPSVTQADPA